MKTERSEPPPSFHYNRIHAWEPWVLDHGLPDMPDTLGDDDQVPIAYWAGPVFGAVLSRYWLDDRDDEDHTVDGARTVFDDHATYRRTATGWVPTAGEGGGGGSLRDPMRRVEVPERFALLGFSWQSGPIVGCDGVVGTAAHTMELIDRHGATRRAIEAPLGLVTACFDGGDDVEVRVLDEGGEVLAEVRRPGEEW